MAKGSPNGEDRKLGFVARVYDPTATDDPTFGKYRPIYIAPEATSSVLGDVYLSDATNSTDNAATGVTAATPAAVKTVQDNANKKLDKEQSGAQTVKSPVTFSGAITANTGVTVPSGQYFTGNLRGNADTASKLTPGASISVKGTGSGTDTATFTGAAGVTLTIGSIDAAKVNTGTLPLSVIPQGALDRLVKVANQSERFALTTATVQLGDTVLQTDTGVMYIVVSESNLNSAAGYQEYKAGTALNAVNAELAEEAVKLQTGRTIRTNLGSTSAATFDGSANITPGVTGTLSVANGGTGGTTKTAAITNLLGGLSPSADDLSDARAVARYVEASGIPSYFTGLNVWNYIKTKTDPLYATSGHTHAVFSTTANGFAPKSDGSATKYLCADGSWKVVNSGVTGVKGNAETTYRTGNVNLTPANIGAAAADHTHSYLPLAGGTLTGTLTSRALTPSANNTYNIGTSSSKYANVYATNFIGNVTGNVTGSLSGNATTATTANRLNKTLTLTGNVTGSVSLNADGTASLATTIANKAVTNGKLADDVGTVYVGTDEPTEAHVKLWVKI